MALALRYFASKGLVHRDLKASNILVADGYHVKLCDFGMSRLTEKSKKSRERAAMTLCGTQEWMVIRLRGFISGANLTTIFAEFHKSSTNR
jgi:serine/threonine protein kinase